MPRRDREGFKLGEAAKVPQRGKLPLRANLGTMGAGRRILPDKDDLLEEEEDQENNIKLNKLQAKTIMEFGGEKWIVWIGGRIFGDPRRLLCKT